MYSTIFFICRFSSCYATAYTFLEHQINVTNVIGSIFLFAGGAGTAIFPILLAEICSKPLYLIYLSIFCSNLALLLFVVMHFITKIRQRQVKLIQDRLMKNPAMLVKIKQRTLSQLSYAPQWVNRVIFRKKNTKTNTHIQIL